jgi:hypothetical protein
LKTMNAILGPQPHDPRAHGHDENGLGAGAQAQSFKLACLLK